MATPVPSATPMARPSVQMPAAQAASDSITPLGPAALAARQLNEAEDQMERWSRALQQLRCPNDETVVRSIAENRALAVRSCIAPVTINMTACGSARGLCLRHAELTAVCGGHEDGVIRPDGRHQNTA